jgi:AmmeMemoRadiSam system protein A
MIGTIAALIDSHRTVLLEVARRTLEAVTLDSKTPLEEVLAAYVPYDPALAEPRAVFITLTTRQDDALRGCTGTLGARLPLIEEVAFSTRNTAFRDPRFTPVQGYEVPLLRIEISILTPPRPLEYGTPQELVESLTPGLDGVTLMYKDRRSTLLPQVWENIPAPADFLAALCKKMGLPGDFWQGGQMSAEIYGAIKLIED